jgi:hypothetical protein
MSKLIEKKLSFSKLFDKITTYDKGIQIYNPGNENTGSGNKDPRDCNDIVAKLLLLLGQKNEVINLKKIKNVEEIKMISNNDDIDKFIPETKIQTRIKQSSDVKVVKAFCKFEEMFNDLRKFIEKMDNKLSKDLTLKYFITLKHYGSNKLVLKELGECYNFFSEKLLQQQKEIVASLLKDSLETEVLGDIIGNTNILEE